LYAVVDDRQTDRFTVTRARLIAYVQPTIIVTMPCCNNEAKIRYGHV